MDNEIIDYEAYRVGDKLSLLEVEHKHTGWMLNNSLIEDGYVIEEDITLYSEGIYDNIVTLIANDQISLTTNIKTDTIEFELPQYVYSQDGRYDWRFVVEGWSLDKVNPIDVSTLKIVNDTTLYAIGYLEWKVSFVVLEETTSQWVKEYTCPVVPEVPDNCYLLGWYSASVSSDSYIDVANWIVSQDITFIAEVISKFSVTFYSGDSVNGYFVYSSYTADYGSLVSLPVDPVRLGHEFVGWSLDGEYIIDLSNYRVSGEMSFYAVFRNVDSMKLTISGNDMPLYAGGHYIEVYGNLNSGGVVVRSTFNLTFDTSIVKSCDFVVDTDGSYEIVTNSLGDYTFNFSDATYANIVVNISFVSDGSYT